MKFKVKNSGECGIPYKTVVKEVVTASGEIVRHPVKVYKSPVPGVNGVCHSLSLHVENQLAFPDGNFTGKIVG